MTHAQGVYGTYDWSLDPVGNRLSESLATGGSTATTTYSYAPGSNQLTGISATGLPPVSFGLTPIGSMASITQSGLADDSYTYNQAQRLTHLVANGLATDYVHDAFGRRVMKSLASGGGSICTFDTDGKMLNENHFPPAGQPGQVILDYIYLDDGRMIGVASTRVAQLYAVHADRLGTPETVSDATQSFVLQESYTPFGLATVSGPQTLFVRAPGQFFESESGPPGLYQNGAREYYPALGRYIESDPIGLGGGINTYAYAGDNPTNDEDPDGLQAIPIEPPYAPPVGGGSGVGIPPNAQPPQWVTDWLNNIFRNPLDTNGGQQIQQWIDQQVQQAEDLIQQMAKGGTQNVADSQIVQDYNRAASEAKMCGQPPPDRCTWLKENQGKYGPDRVKKTAKQWGCKWSSASKQK